MGVMMLAAGKGSTVPIETDGADEEQAIARAHQADRRQVRRRRMNFVLSRSIPCLGRHRRSGSAARLARALEVAHYEIAPEAVEAEIARFDRAMTTAQEELDALKAHIPAGSPAEFGAFLDVHRMILNDPTLSEAPSELIRKQRCNAEWALTQQMERAGRAVRARSRTRTCASARPTSCRSVERVLKRADGQAGRSPRRRCRRSRS